MDGLTDADGRQTVGRKAEQGGAATDDLAERGQGVQAGATAASAGRQRKREVAAARESVAAAKS